jgi:hypothetical protein
MIYKRYELSLSLNGNDVVHIARNAAGNVVFRESSEEDLKNTIDESIEEKRKLDAIEEKKRLEKARAKSQKRGLFAPPPEEEEDVKDEGDVTEKTDSVLVPTQQSVVRGPDGKFISKNSLQEEEEPKKKSFWDR